MALWLGLWGVHRAVPSRDETPNPKIHSQGKTEAKAVGSCCLPVCTCCLHCALLPQCTIYRTGAGMEVFRMKSPSGVSPQDKISMSTQSLLVISAGHKGDRFPTFQEPWTLGLVWYTTVILVPGKLSRSILGSILTWATQ